MTDPAETQPAGAHDVGGGPALAESPATKSLSAAAERALAEAAARRAVLDARARDLTAVPEHQGRGGLDPVRYEDWEIGGRAVDF